MSITYPKDDIRGILQDFFKNYEKGIFYGNFLTGQGKTFSAVRYMFDLLFGPEEDEEVKRNSKFVFIIPEKKLRPENEINKYPDLAAKTLIVKSIEDSYLELLGDRNSLAEEELFGKEFEEDLKKYEKTDPSLKPIINSIRKQRKNLIDALIKYKKCKKQRDKELLEYRRSKFLEAESLTRKVLKRYFRKTIDKKDYYNKFDTSLAYSEIRKLYPIYKMASPDIKLIVLTATKLTCPLDTFIWGTYSGITELKALITKLNKDIKYLTIIDEADRCVEYTQSSAYEEYATPSISIYNLTNCLLKIPDISLPSKFTKDEKLASCCKQIIDEINRYDSKYGFIKNKSLKIKNDEITFLKDETYGLRRINGTKEKIEVISLNEEENIVEIYDTDKRKPDETDFFEFLKDTITFIERILRFISILALYYRNYINKENKEKSEEYEEMTKESAISSILKVFDLVRTSDDTDKYDDPLFQYIIALDTHPKPHSRYSTTEINLNDFTYFSRGFQLLRTVVSYGSFENDDIFLVVYAASPENTIIRLAQQSPVVLLSATIDFDTSVGNLYQEYVKSYVPIYESSEEVIEATKQKYGEKFNLDYEGIINKVYIPRDYKKNLANKTTPVFPLSEFLSPIEELDIEEKLNKIADSAPKVIISIDAIRDLKESLLAVMKLMFAKAASSEEENGDFNMFTLKDLHSQMLGLIKRYLTKGIGNVDLSFSTKLYKKEKPFVLEFIVRLWILLLIYAGAIKTYEELESYISEYEDCFKELHLTKKHEGKKIFFIDSEDVNEKEDIQMKIQAGLGYHVYINTSYKTIGAGQNLQYPLPFKDACKVKATNKDARTKLNEFINFVAGKAKKEGISPEEIAAKYLKEDKLKGDHIEDEELTLAGIEYPFVDISYCFVSEPTNVAGNFSGSVRNGSAEMISRFDAIYRLEADGSLSSDETSKILSIIAANKGQYFKINHAYGVRVKKLVDPKQGIGRTQRTQYRYPVNMFVIPESFALNCPWETIKSKYADDKVIEAIQEEIKKVPFYDKARKALKTLKKNQEMEVYVRRNNTAGQYFSLVVRMMFENKDYIPLYDKLRDFLFHFTKITKETIEDNQDIGLQDFLVKNDGSGRYSCTPVKNSEYSKITSFSRDLSEKKKCSVNSMKLPVLAECIEFNKGLQAEDIDLDWKEAEYLLLPAALQIYKGCLGELLTKIISKCLSIELEKLPEDKNEIMDYKIKDKNIYFDAKYQELEAFEALVMDELEKYINKLNQLADEDTPAVGIILNTFPVCFDKSIEIKKLKISDNKTLIFVRCPYLKSEEDWHNEYLMDILLPSFKREMLEITDNHEYDERS